MAQFDVAVQDFFWIFVIPGTAIVALCVVFRARLHCLHMIHMIYKKLFAYGMNRLTTRMNRLMRHRKQRLFRELHDAALNADRQYRIVEIGAGSGANFEFYPDNVTVCCVDPNPYFEQYLQTNADKYPSLAFQYIEGVAEDMSRIPDSSVDAVVSTMVMCSVTDVDSCLCEIKRILKPGGKYFYFEHVAADENSFTSRVQNLLTKPWRFMFDGCTLSRHVHRHLQAAGFSTLDFKRSWPTNVSNILFLMKTTLIGTATK